MGPGAGVYTVFGCTPVFGLKTTVFGCFPVFGLKTTVFGCFGHCLAVLATVWLFWPLFGCTGLVGVLTGLVGVLTGLVGVLDGLPGYHGRA